MPFKLIEDAVREKLTGETQKNTLDFLASMRENGFSFVGFGDGDETAGWDPSYNGNGFGCVLVADDFMFFIGLDWHVDDSRSPDDELKAFAWANVRACPQEPCKPPYCQGDNHCKNRWQLFGREYESTCHSPLQFIGPDAVTLENLKKLLLMTK